MGPRLEIANTSAARRASYSSAARGGDMRKLVARPPSPIKCGRNGTDSNYGETDRPFFSDAVALCRQPPPGGGTGIGGDATAPLQRRGGHESPGAETPRG